MKKGKKRTKKVHKNPTKLIKIPLDVFNNDIWVFVAHKPEQIVRSLKKEGFKNVDRILSWKFGSLGYAWSEDGLPVVWLKYLPKDPESIGTLAHEAYHAACYLGEFKGIKYDTDKSEEFYAYVLGHIVETVLDNYK